MAPGLVSPGLDGSGVGVSVVTGAVPVPLSPLLGVGLDESCSDLQAETAAQSEIETAMASPRTIVFAIKAGS